MAANADDVAEIVSAFAHATIDPSQWMPAMTLMSEAIGSASSSMELADRSTGLTSLYCTFHLDDDILAHYEERIFAINPRVRRARNMPVGALVDDSTLLAHDDPNMGEFIDWLDKTPNWFVQGAKLLQDDGHEIYFGSYYSKSQGPPPSLHADVHRHIIPHLVNFVAIGRALSGRQLTNELTTLATLQSDRPFALLQRDGRVVECSIGFEDTIRRSDLLGLRDRRFVAIHAQHRKIVERFVACAVGEQRLMEPPLPIRLSNPDSPRGLVLRAMPLAPNSDIFDVLQPTTLITLSDLDKPLRTRQRDLIALFALTPREAEITGLIAEGFPPEHIAHRLGISGYTVRQHLKSAYGKIGVSRQAELATLVSKMSP